MTDEEKYKIGRRIIHAVTVEMPDATMDEKVKELLRRIQELVEQEIREEDAVKR